MPAMVTQELDGHVPDDETREGELSFKDTSKRPPLLATPSRRERSGSASFGSGGEPAGGGQAAALRTSIRTAIVNRKSAMLLLSQAKARKLQNLCSFLPTIVLRKLSEMTREEAVAMKPDREDFHECAVVMLDMCGFTRLAEGLRHGKLLLNNDASQPPECVSAGARNEGYQSAEAGPSDHCTDRGGLAKSCSRTMMSAKLLRLQTTEEAQAGFGAEQLKVLLNAFFKLLITTITDHGGDVLRLAGDALIVAFTDGHGEKGKVDPCLLRRAAMVCALCLKLLDGMTIEGHVMHLHAALGVGTLELYTVGEAKEGWQYVAAGEPFSELSTAMDDGTEGQMVLSRSYWNGMTTVGEAQKAQPLQADGTDTSRKDATVSLDGVDWRTLDLESGNIWIEATADGSEIEAALRRGSAGASFQQRTRNVHQELMLKQDFLERVIRRFIPAPILYVCEAEQSGWFAEIGRVAVIFVKIDINRLPGFGVMQRVFLVLQRAMKAYQGVVKEFSVDDKGTVMVGALGLPPITGSNPSARACVTALRIMNGIQGLGIVCYIGISFGPVFTASIGGERREFMLVGDVVNTAARLMSAGKKLRADASASGTGSAPAEQEMNGETSSPVIDAYGNGAIVVDSVTAGLASGLVEFRKLGTIQVKGKSMAVEVYTPLKCLAGSDSVGMESAMIGHAALRAKMLEKASLLVQGYGGGLLLLQGEPGVGKTCLINECGREWQREGVKTLGLNRQQDRRSNQMPFAAWRGVMQSVLLLYRSAVLATAEAEERSAAHVPSNNAHIQNEAGPTNGIGSIPSSLEHVGQASADGNAATDEAKSGSLIGADSVSMPRRSSTMTETMTPLKADCVKDMAQQLESEAGILRSMCSMADTPRAADSVHEEDGGNRDSQEKRGTANATTSSFSDTRENGPTSEKHRLELDERTENNPQRGEDGLKQPATAKSDADVLSESVLFPSWAGAFGAVPEMDDDARARGFYARRFCELFFPDNVMGATDVLCTLLDGILPPATPLARPAPAPGTDPVTASFESSCAAVGPIAAGSANNHKPESSDDGTDDKMEASDGEIPLSLSPPPPTTIEEMGLGPREGTSQSGKSENSKGGAPSGLDAARPRPSNADPDTGDVSVGERGRREREVGGLEIGGFGFLSASCRERPEKSRFEVLLGMLTIATMVDAGGAAMAGIGAVITSSSRSRKEVADIALGTDSGTVESMGATTQATGLEIDGGGERPPQARVTGCGVIAVLDNAQEMDSCSCDLVKASTKYLHERLLLVLVSPPLPATIKVSTKHKKKTTVDGQTVQGVEEEDSGECGSTSDSDGIGDDESQISFFKGVLPGAGEVEVDQHSLIPLDSSAPNPFDDDGLVQATAALANSSNSDNDRDTKKSQSVHPSVAVSTSPDNNCIQAASDRRLPTPTSSRTQNSSVEDGDSDGVYSSEEGISSCNEPNASLDFDGNSIGQDDADPCVSRGKQHRTRNTSRASKNNLAEQFEREPKGRDDNRSYSKDRNGAEGRGTVGDQGQQRDMNTRRVPRMASGIRRSETKRKTRKDLQEGGGADDEEGGQEGTENVHHLQISAAAFMEAGNAAVGAGSIYNIAPMAQRGRRDSGFVRYWNTGTTKLLDILAGLQHKTSVEVVRVEHLRYADTVQLMCRHLGCGALDPLVGVALYLRTHGNPLYIIAYCNLVLELKLGENVTISAEPTSKSGQSHPSTRAVSSCPPSSSPSDNEDDTETPSPPGNTNTKSPDCERCVAAGGDTVVAAAVESDEAPGALNALVKVATAKRAMSVDGRNMSKPQEQTIFRFQESVNVFKVLEATVPAIVESRIIDFLSCLSAQQTFVLRVMSVIGISGIESDLLEAVYPIPVRGNPIREDLEALEACRLIKIERVAPARSASRAHLGVPSVSKNRIEPRASGVRRDGEAEGGGMRSVAASRRKAGRLLLSFRNLVVHQVAYTKVSHTHRRELHASITEWIAGRQWQSTLVSQAHEGGKETEWEDTGDAIPEELEHVASLSCRRGSFELGKAGAKGRTRATSKDCIPMLVHHFTLAHQEQKAMIRAHLFGVRELEQWAMGAFAAMLETRAGSVPKPLLVLAGECKALMWLCPSLVGILKTLLAIRSGAGVSNATRKFRHTIQSSRERFSLDDIPSDVAALPGRIDEGGGENEELEGEKLEGELVVDPRDDPESRQKKIENTEGGSGSLSVPETVKISSSGVKTTETSDVAPETRHATQEFEASASWPPPSVDAERRMRPPSDENRPSTGRSRRAGALKRRERRPHDARSTSPASTSLKCSPPTAAAAALIGMTRPQTAPDTPSGTAIFVTTSSLVSTRAASARVRSRLNKPDLMARPATPGEQRVGSLVWEGTRKQAKSADRGNYLAGLACARQSGYSTVLVPIDTTETRGRSSAWLRGASDEGREIRSKSHNCGLYSPCRCRMVSRSGALSYSVEPILWRERMAAKLENLRRIYGGGVSLKRGSLRVVSSVVSSLTGERSFRAQRKWVVGARDMGGQGGHEADRQASDVSRRRAEKH